MIELIAQRMAEGYLEYIELKNGQGSLFSNLPSPREGGEHGKFWILLNKVGEKTWSYYMRGGGKNRIFEENIDP